jgi:hypothetical protein
MACFDFIVLELSNNIGYVKNVCLAIRATDLVGHSRP